MILGTKCSWLLPTNHAKGGPHLAWWLRLGILNRQEAETLMGQEGHIGALSYSTVKRRGSWGHGSAVETLGMTWVRFPTRQLKITFSYSEHPPSVVAHTCNPIPQRLRQED